MAENVRWALEREGPDGRVLVYAHDAHVMNSTLTGGPWSVFREPPAMMGKSLRSALGDDLVIIGSAIGATSGGLPLVYQDSTSVDVALARARSGSYAIDLRGARDAPDAWRWLSQPHPLRANIATFAIVAPATAFDAMVFIDTLTPARE
jgi:erythromycin esterase